MTEFGTKVTEGVPRKINTASKTTTEKENVALGRPQADKKNFKEEEVLFTSDKPSLLTKKSVCVKFIY